MFAPAISADASSGVQDSTSVSASIERTILQDASMSMGALLNSLSTTGPTGRFINALA
jgi:hypothetical protein